MSTDDLVQCDGSFSDGELSNTSIESLETSSYSDASLTSSDTSDSEKNLSEDNVSDSANTNALKILSCFQRHKLTASACRDILKMVKSVSVSDSLNLFDYEHLMSFVPTTSYKDIHYCEKCESIFPENKAVYRCSDEHCPGLRYMGYLSQQHEMKQPVKSFMVADIRKLLRNLLKSPGKLFNIYFSKNNNRKVTCLTSVLLSSDKCV